MASSAVSFVSFPAPFGQSNATTSPVATDRRKSTNVRAGLLHVPEGQQVVAPLTRLENLQLAGLASRRCPRKELNDGFERVFSRFPSIARRRDVASGLLGGGEQQMLAIGRALIARLIALLLDESSTGLSPLLTETIYEFLARRAEDFADVAVVLAEQSLIAPSVAHRVWDVDVLIGEIMHGYSKLDADPRGLIPLPD